MQSYLRDGASSRDRAQISVDTFGYNEALFDIVTCF